MIPSIIFTDIVPICLGYINILLCPLCINRLFRILRCQCAVCIYGDTLFSCFFYFFICPGFICLFSTFLYLSSILLRSISGLFNQQLEIIGHITVLSILLKCLQQIMAVITCRNKQHSSQCHPDTDRQHLFFTDKSRRNPGCDQQGRYRRILIPQKLCPYHGKSQCRNQDPK